MAAPSSTSYAGRAYLWAFDGVRESGQLWASDGTPEGTVLVSPDSGEPAAFFEVDGLLLYLGSPDLWRSDGTTTGTMRIASPIPIGGYLASTEPVVAGKRLYFAVRSAGRGTVGLWASDGTAPERRWSRFSRPRAARWISGWRRSTNASMS